MSCKKNVNTSIEDADLAYSTVLEVECSKLVVICGQVAEDSDDNIVGTTIEDQATQVFKNCQAQLIKANCTLDDVFKVNIYLQRIEDWPRFNDIFKAFFSTDPKPVRTTVQAGLLPGFLIEVELWAAKR
jgi:2-iminobutanoate/2-iminopropanoate deaminase